MEDVREAYISSVPTFVVTEPTRAFLQAQQPLMPHEWSWAHEITLAPGTRLRYLRAGGYGDACSAIFMDWDEFALLEGNWSGQVVLIEDAATPRDANGNGHHHGWRPRCGPPATVAPEVALPPDWQWRVVNS